MTADTSAEGIAAAFTGGGRGGAVEPAQQKIWDLIGMKPPAGGRGGAGFGGGGTLVEPGTYVVTLSAGGQTYKQTVRVERSGTGDGDGGGAFENDEEDNQDLNGGVFPKSQTSPYIRRDHQ